MAGFLLENRALRTKDDYFEARLFTKAKSDLISLVKKWFNDNLLERE